MVVTIRGIQFQDIDFMELDTATAYEDGLESFKKISDTMSAAKSVSQQIIKLHECVSEWLDSVLGDGASDAVFGGKANMHEAALAAAELIKAYRTAISEMKESVESAFEDAGISTDDIRPSGQNRAQRRAAQRNKGKTAKTTRTAKIVPQEPEEDDSEQ